MANLYFAEYGIKVVATFVILPSFVEHCANALSLDVQQAIVLLFVQTVFIYAQKA
jgi:hypothetical protein